MKFVLSLLFIVLMNFNFTLADEEFENPQARAEWLESTYRNENVDIPQDFKIRQEKLSNSLPNASEGLFTKGSQISSQTWMHAGPNNVGGRTRAIVYDRMNPNILITGGVSGGIWRSIDAGQSWVQTTGITDIPAVSAIIQDPRPGRNNEWYCAGGELLGYSSSRDYSSWYSGNGIFKSTDNGLTWNLYGNTADNLPQVTKYWDYIFRLAIDPTNLDEDILYVACLGAVIKISENGEKISTVMNLENNTYYNYTTDIIITGSGKFYATLSQKSRYSNKITSHSGIFYSEDGENWKDISPQTLQPSHRIVMDYSRSHDSIVYFFCSNIPDISTGCNPDIMGCVSLFKLNNNAGQIIWSDLTDNIPYFPAEHEYNTLNPQEEYCMGIAVSPNDTNTVILGATNCFVSYNGFSSPDSSLWIGGFNPEYDERIWSDTTKTLEEIYKNELQMMHPNSGWDYHWFTFNPENPNEVLSASDHGLHKLADISYNAPKEWTDLNNGYCTTQFYDCAINRKVSGNDDIIGGTQDNGTLCNFFNTLSFDKYWGGDGFTSYITEDNSIIFCDYINIFRLQLNQGQLVSGSILSVPSTENNTYGIQFHTKFDINPYNEKELTVATAKVIAYVKDISIINAYNYYEYHFIDDLETSCIKYLAPTHNGVLIGTRNKRLIKVNDLSKDNFSYDIINLPDFVTGNFVSDVWTDHSNVDHFIAIVSNYLTLGMLETYDNGKTWIDHGGNLEEFPDGTGAGHSFRCYEKLVYEGDTLHLLGTSDGLFSTKKLDGENTVWLREGANTIGKAVIEDIEVRELDGRIVVATHGNGLFKTNYSTSVEDFDGSNLGFVVSEVFPNPASSSINCIVNTDEVAKIDVKLMDLNGNEIAKISSEEFTATKNINFDISNLTAGTYFIHISNGNHFVTKKVNIVR